MALFVTSTMRRRHLPVMAFHSVPADVVVNDTPISVHTRVRQNSTSTPDAVLEVNPQVQPVMATGYIEACQSLP